MHKNTPYLGSVGLISKGSLRMKLGNFRSRYLLPVAVVLLMSGNTANAQFYSSDANPDSIGGVEVRLFDNAIDACWTNLREVREYAEEKLRLKGYQQAEPSSNGYKMNIIISAQRLDDGGCVYDIDLHVNAPRNVSGVFGYHLVGTHGSSGYNNQNANNVIISKVGEMINAM